MKLSDVVIGNSSSGIIEAPFLGVPTLNIGNRQKGRLHDVSVIDCGTNEIAEKLKLLLGQKFQVSSLYGDGNNAVKITSFLKKADFKVKSGFYDL